MLHVAPENGTKPLANFVLLKCELPKRKTPHGETERLQVCIAQTIPFECIACRTVECKTVAFDDRHLLSPKKVDTVRSDACLELERWKTG